MELHPLVQGQERRGLEHGALKRRVAGPIGRALWSAHCQAMVLLVVNVTGAKKKDEYIQVNIWEKIMSRIIF